jgi:FkbM family methyltransferase
VDVGANPIDGTPPYMPMLAAGLCRVTGFEPQHEALIKLQRKKGPSECYLPYAVGDGDPHTLNICRYSGMTSLLEPDPATLGLFGVLKSLGEVIEPVLLQTRRLDDISEVQHVDFLKIDIQGSELAVFKGGKAKLTETVAIQTEISFVTLYQDQPVLGDVDLELRSQGFLPHCFAAIKRWPIAPYMNTRKPLSQLLEADIVYVRDFAHADSMSDEQLKQLALIAHHCYGSFDLALRCVMLLEQRQALQAGTQRRYLAILGSRRVTNQIRWD